MLCTNTNNLLSSQLSILESNHLSHVAVARAAEYRITHSLRVSQVEPGVLWNGKSSYRFMYFRYFIPNWGKVFEPQVPITKVN